MFGTEHLTPQQKEQQAIALAKAAKALNMDPSRLLFVLRVTLIKVMMMR
jgi:hypothetical protein